MKTLFHKHIKQEDSLRCLIMATSLLSKARLTKDKYLYRVIFEMVKSIEKFFTHSSIMHYVLGVTRLNGWGDLKYALEKWELISELGPAYSIDLAEILKGEIDLFAGVSSPYQGFLPRAQLSVKAA